MTGHVLNGLVCLAICIMRCVGIAVQVSWFDSGIATFVLCAIILLPLPNLEVEKEPALVSITFCLAWNVVEQLWQLCLVFILNCAMLHLQVSSCNFGPSSQTKMET